MITDDMIHGRFAQRRARRIEEDTPIVPRAWRRRLAIRADRVYRRNAHFRDLMGRSGDAGRDWLWAFTRHWLAALLRKHHPELHRRLPAEYNVGASLPIHFCSGPPD